MSELDEGTQEVTVDLGTTEQVQETSDTAADSPEINQEAVNAKINEKHREKMEAKREAQQEKKRADNLAAELAELKKKPAPTVPEQPDMYADNFAELQADRELRISELAVYNNEQARLQADRDTASNAVQAAKQQAGVERLNGFVARTKELGIDINEVDAAGKTLDSYGVGDDLGSYLLGDADGPLLVQYLAKQPAQLEQLAAMSPMEAAVFIHSTVRPEAQKLKPKQSSTPDPTTVLSGAGAVSGDKRSRGATFE